MSGQFATEAYQASWYKQMLDLLSCDPNVQFVNIFHLIDESALEGWQSGIYFADQSAEAVRPDGPGLDRSERRQLHGHRPPVDAGRRVGCDRDDHDKGEDGDDEDQDKRRRTGQGRS